MDEVFKDSRDIAFEEALNVSANLDLLVGEADLLYRKVRENPTSCGWGSSNLHSS